MKSALLFASSKSRNGQAHFEQAKGLLETRGIRVERAEIFPNKKIMCKAVRKAIKAGHRFICVAAGDGGQTAVASEFAHTKAVLGVIPAGTGNSFALSLGIESFEQSIDAIAGGRVEKVDLGIANGCYFANFATIGLSSDVAAQTPHALKKVIGAVAYGLATVVPMLRHEPFKCSVRSKAKNIDIQTHHAIVVNGRYYGHQPIAADATVTSGKLAFFSHAGTTTVDAAKSYIALLRGEHTELDAAEQFHAKTIRIRTSPRQLVSIDGSALCKTPVKFSVAPGALRVFVPQAFSAAEPENVSVA